MEILTLELDRLTEQQLLGIYYQQQVEAVLTQSLHQKHQSLDDVVDAIPGFMSLKAVSQEKLASLEIFYQQEVLSPVLKQVVLHVGHAGNLKSISPMHLISDVAAKEDPEAYRGQLKKFSLRELQVATDDFSDKNIIGTGGFGKVYKGRLADGSLVAVKRLKEERTPDWEQQFQTEVDILSTVAHRNLLRLCGFCRTPTEKLLVYPYMTNGSVASHLREWKQGSEPPLDWKKRRRIALGSARGLSYLHDHCDPKIIHRDVKAANILLDEDFEAVVGDFGLAKLMDYKDTDVTTAVSGTFGHMAPEYLSTGKASEKTDVFGYGIVLLELATGKRPYDITRLASDGNVKLLDWVKALLKKKKLEDLVDDDLKPNYYYINDEVESLIQIALICTQSSPEERPKMSEVVRMLEGDGDLAERWEAWQKVAHLEVELGPHGTSHWNWNFDDSELNAVELSGPR